MEMEPNDWIHRRRAINGNADVVSPRAWGRYCGAIFSWMAVTDISAADA